MSFKPPVLYRITGHLNVMIWRLPLPRRVLARLSMMVYRNPPMPGEHVLRVLDALERAGISCWVRGGWGVDALVGRETRVHDDLDLVVDMHKVGQAVEALRDLGFREWYRVDSDAPLFTRVVVRDHEVAGRAVDLQPLDLSTGHVQFAMGSINGRSVPCMSLESQLATHSDYRKRRRDHADLALLRKLALDQSTSIQGPSGADAGTVSVDTDTGPGDTETRSATAVRVSAALGPVPSPPHSDDPTMARRIVRRLLRGPSTVLVVPVREVDDMRHPSALEAGMPAHITVLYPFLRARAVDRRTVAILGSVLEEMPAIDFTLSEIRRFPNVVYLAPEPAAPFVAMTEAVLEHWPDQRPYGGIFEEIVPHVTVAYREATPHGVAERLPIHARAQEVWLMTRVGNRWVRRKRFALGSSPQMRA